MRKQIDIYVTIIITLFLSIAMLWPIKEQIPGPEFSDKLIHILGFGALAFPLAQTKRFSILYLFLVASIFGGIIEIIQPSFGRSAEIGDWLADTIGVIMGIAAGLFYRWVWREKF